MKINPEKNLFGLLFSLFFLSFSVATYAKNETNSYQMLIGGSLKTCSSYSLKQCLKTENASISAALKSGKKDRQFQFSHGALVRIETQWPLSLYLHDQVEPGKSQVLTALKKIKPSSKVLSRYDVLDEFEKVAPTLLDSLSDRAYYFVLDQLEIMVVNTELAGQQNQRNKEVVFSELSKEAGSREILAVIQAVAKSSSKKRIFSITASSRDPYESADFYQGLFDTPTLNEYQVVSEWLPLTPALAKAVKGNNCDKLDDYRQQQGTFNREQVYPDLTQAEHALCKLGIEGIKTKLQSASVVMLNGGDQSLTRQVFFDDQGKAYPWLEDLLGVHMLVGTSAGTAVQSGGENLMGRVPMITNGNSLQALKTGAHSTPAPSARCQDAINAQQGLTHDANEAQIDSACSSPLHPDSLTYLAAGGLGSFKFGVLDTHFSERNRAARLFTLLAETNQRLGFGVDETSALLVANSGNGQAAEVAVLGKSGVAVIEPILSGSSSDAGTAQNDSFYYSYWPSGAKANLSLEQGIVDVSHQQAVKEKLRLSLPTELPPRFEDILTNGKLRSLTQVMCMTNKTSSEGIQRDGLTTWQLSFEKTPETRFTLYSVEKNRCAIERLKITVNKLKLRFG
ncbi:cyanophycinase [Psychrosphaera ytuae]|uniref:Cyanophycinase n=1 Tax=Psychrosphaera ytuae TaxID=2820710 RepID=A0A975DD74_9GAMM|nr:cyanophycinase [Psychrosphaera ytuae]QTH63505.1 cyanophycinase [Psychrosphaera ytuae]